MDILGVGTNELVVIMLMAAIVLGPERLARVAREAGKFIKNAKSYIDSFSDELKSELDVIDDLKSMQEEILKK